MAIRFETGLPLESLSLSFEPQPENNSKKAAPTQNADRNMVLPTGFMVAYLALMVYTRSRPTEIDPPTGQAANGRSGPPAWTVKTIYFTHKKTIIAIIYIVLQPVFMSLHSPTDLFRLTRRCSPLNLILQSYGKLNPGHLILDI